MKTSSDRQRLALCQEIMVAESNGDVRMLNGNREIAVFTQCKLGQKQPITTGATSAGRKWQCIAVVTLSS